MAARPVFIYQGAKYHVGNLKVREVEDLETSLGCRYVEIAPMGNMRHKLAVMAVLLLRDRTTEQVAEIIGNLSLDEVDEMWAVEDDDLPDVYQDGVPDPKAGGGPSTPISSISPPPTATTGRRRSPGSRASAI